MLIPGMKILLTGKQDINLIGGIETTLRLLAKTLVKEGHQVAVLYFDRKNVLFQSFQENGIQFFVAPVTPSRIPGILFRNYAIAAERAISKILITFLPDQIWSRYAIATQGIISNQEFQNLNIRLLHIYPTTARLQYKSNMEAISLLSFCRKPKLYLLGILYYLENKSAESFVVKSPRAESIVFSRNTQERLSRETKFPQSKLRIVRPGVDPDVFNGEKAVYMPHEMIEALKKLTFGFAIYVGRLEANKHVDMLVESFQYVEALNLVIVGEGSQKVELIKLARRLRLHDRIFFIGHQSLHLKYLYQQAECTILPSRIESFGMVLLESLACGTPVIAFGGENHYTAAEEIILYSFNGSVVHEFTPEALGREVNKLNLLEDTVKVKNRELNIDYIKNGWSIESMIFKLLNEGERY